MLPVLPYSGTGVNSDRIIPAGFAQKATFVMFRVISWIDFGVKLKAIHELTRTKKKTDLSWDCSHTTTFCAK